MTDDSVTRYKQLNDLVASVQQGRPRSQVLVESTLEAVRAFVPDEVGNLITLVLTAPTADYSRQEVRV